MKVIETKKYAQVYNGRRRFSATLGVDVFVDEIGDQDVEKLRARDSLNQLIKSWDEYDFAHGRVIEVTDLANFG
tara:strand:+ start:10890 stop:11111 length:222 start_codon:yes stop_codon:yes gene_type:complete